MPPRILIPALAALSLAAAPIPKKPTFHKDIEPILQARCQGCHRPGEAAPFSLLTYAQARPWAKAIKQAAASGKMPPWNADPAVGHWKNDRRLTADEKAILAAWADTGAAQGKAKDAPPPVKFTEGWQIGTPDAVLSMSIPYEVPATGEVDYQWIVVPGFKEDRWIEAFEVRPGERSVVHHVAAFLRRPGSKWLADLQPGVPSAKPKSASEGGSSDGIIAEYVPGVPPVVLPAGYAFHLPAGTDIMLQVHYTPNGKAVKDVSKVGMIFAKEPPKFRVLTTAAANPGLRIPAGAPNHVVKAMLPFGTDVEVLGINPHMHLRGKSAAISIKRPDGQTEQILHVPQYDFNWQLTYEPKTPWKWPAGTLLEASLAYDNSPNNRANPDPTKEVRWGDQTSDEMMAVYMHVAIPMGVDPRTLHRRPQPAPYAKPSTGALD